MAERQFAFDASDRSEFFADDDPLAELARIVGFEPKPALKRDAALTPPVAPQPPPVMDPEFEAESVDPDLAHDDTAEALDRLEAFVSAPQEDLSIEPDFDVAEEHVPAVERDPIPAQTVAVADHPVMAWQDDAEPGVDLDLEDELLREFERYDAPETAEAAWAPNLAEAEPEEIAQVAAEPAFLEAPAEEVRAPELEIVFDDDFDAMFASHAAEVASAPPAYADIPEPVAVEPPMDEHPAHTDPAHTDIEPVAVEADDASDWMSDLPVADVETPEPSYLDPRASIVADHADDPQLDLTDDLAAELEQSIGASVNTDPAPAVLAAPAFRLPLANYHSARAEPGLASPQPDRAVTSAHSDPFQPAPFEHVVDSLDARAAVELPLDLGILPEHDRHEPADLVGHSPAKDSLGLEDLLSEVERYPVPSYAESRRMPVEMRREPVVEPPLSAIISPPVIPPVSIRQAAAAPIGMSRPVAEQDIDQPFDLDDFELDLDGIELELSDLGFESPVLSAAPPAAPYKPAATPLASVAAAPVMAAAMTRAEPVRPLAPSQTIETAAAAAAAAAATFALKPPEPEILPFDPSLISETEERPESLADLHVPSLPVIEPDEPLAVQPDYDIDLDAEMASLFGNGQASGIGQRASDAAPSRDQSSDASGDWSDVPSRSAGQQNGMDDFDDFERALEEDFRRSMSEPLDDSDGVEKMALAPAGYIAVSKPRSRRGLFVGVAVFAIVVMGGVAAYSLMSGEGGALIASSSSSSGPRVITADEEPVKVVPENKGGKTVPNQDKAVYDRVAGNATDTPQQGALVSTSEEPVDVVQKTLIPENMPMTGAEDEEMAISTPVGETEDARLLPDQNESAAVPAAPDTTKPAGVSPRKVRTMIVKADGTLVAREVDAPEEAPALAQPTTPAAAPVAPAQTAATTPATEAAALTPPPSEPAAEQSVEDVVNNAPAVEAPVRVVKTTSLGDNAPVPTARPSDQPVNVVGTVTDQGNVRTKVTGAVASESAAAELAAATVAPAAASGTYGMQIASLPSEAEAKISSASMQSKFASVIGGRSMEIRKADIAGKGTYYRVRVPVGTRDEANALCARFKAAGGSCLVSR